MHSLTRRPALSGPINTPGINRCGPFHKLGKFCKVGSICSSGLLFSNKLHSLPSSSHSDGSSSNCSLQDSLRSERQEPSTGNLRCCKSIGVLEHHDVTLNGLPQLPRVELANLNRNGISSKRIVKKHDPSKTTANRSHRRIEKSGSFDERNAKYRVSKKKHEKRVSKPLPSMNGRRQLSKKRVKVLKRRPPVSTSRRNKKSKLTDLFFYRAINQEEPDIGTVEHAGVQGGGDNADGNSSTVKNSKTTDVNHPNLNDGLSLLMDAAENGHLQDLKELLEIFQSDPNEFDDFGEATLMCAAEHGHLQAVEKLIESGANVNFSNRYGGTALMNAAEHGHLQAVEKLIKSGATVDQPNDIGWTALMFTVENGHLEVVEKLIESGAKVDQPNCYGETPLMKAAGFDSRSNHRKDPALLYAADYGNLKIVAKLIESGANVNHSNHREDTALLYAADYGNLKIVAKLIESGATVNHSNCYGDTALMNAAKHGYLQVVKELIKKANINQENRKGETALTFAARGGYSDIEDLLRQS